MVKSFEQFWLLIPTWSDAYCVVREFVFEVSYFLKAALIEVTRSNF
jgi:hypothetical protein